jgi:hypothetical protein
MGLFCLKGKPMPPGHSEVLGNSVPNPAKSGNPVKFFYVKDDEGNPVKEIPVSGIEQRIKAQFEQWVRKGAQRAIASMMRDTDTDEVTRYRSTYMADFGTGKYNWPENSPIKAAGTHIRNALNDISGRLYLFYLLLKRCDASMTEDKATELVLQDPEQVGEIVGFVLGNGQAPQGAKEGKLALDDDL